MSQRSFFPRPFEQVESGVEYAHWASCPVSSKASADLRLLTELLERSRRARLDRVILDWERSAQPAQLAKRPDRFLELVAWLIQLFFLSWASYRQQRREAVALDLYLSTAHLHAAVAREASSASRRWFAYWRAQARVALRLGVSPRALLAILRSTPADGPTRGAVRKPAPRRGTAAPEARERLRNVIFPNAPAAVDFLRQLATGDGLAIARI